MRLFRFYEQAQIIPGVEINDLHYSLAGEEFDYDKYFLEGGGLEQLRKFVQTSISQLKALPGRPNFAPCIANPGKIVCVGLNYEDHARETGAKIPSEPVLFMKSTTSICGAFQPLRLPRNSIKTDWEVELAVIIGKRASYVEQSQAELHIAGYALFNDYSERSFQKERGGQWVKGKSADSFGPLGPYFVPANEVGDPHSLRMWLSVNGEVMQDSSTARMLFKIPFLVSYISEFMTLEAGDIISTGTPAGVGLGRKPELYLKAGDIVKYGIDQLGQAEHEVVSWDRAKI